MNTAQGLVPVKSGAEVIPATPPRVRFAEGVNVGDTTKTDSELVEWKNATDDRNLATMARVLLIRHLRGTRLYKDTVPRAVIATRRRRNKVAKASRKMNRV